MVSAILYKKNASFFELKGVIEVVLSEIGISNIGFKQRTKTPGADIFINKLNIGYIEILDDKSIDFELNYQELLKHANNKKTYKKLTKFPAILEDITFVLDSSILTEDVINEILIKSFLIKKVTLKDRYEDSRTFHIEYQAEDKNLSSKEIKEIHIKIIAEISEKFGAEVK